MKTKSKLLKFVSVICVMAMLLSAVQLTGLTAFAETGGDFEYEILDDGTARITGYNGSTADLTIPSSLDGYTVTSIGDYVFEYSYSLENVIIPDSVTSIGYWTFSECYNLKSVTVGSSVTSIGEGAFSGCYRLKNITIGNSVTSIGDWAFEYCNELNHILYSGTEEQWNNIRIGEGNSDIYYATIHYEISETPISVSIITEPTCTEYGQIQYSCSICGEEYDGLVSAIGHTKGEELETVPPTCVSDGYTTCVCSVCGEEYTDEWFPSLWHTRGEKLETVPPTCTEDGYTTCICSVCGEEYTDDWLPSLGHTKGEELETVPPTCTSDGYTMYICSVCDEVFETDWTYEDHNFSILLESYEPTCTERGFDVYRCANCDNTDVTYTEDALGHTFSNDICNRCGMQRGDCLESSHPYSNGEDTYWTLEKPGASSVAVTFSRDTFVEWDYDYIYIYDAVDNLIGEYTGDWLAGARIVVPGDTVKIRLVTDSSVTKYGFAVKKVETDVPLEIECDGVIMAYEQFGTIPSNAELNVFRTYVADTTQIYDIYLTVDGEKIQPNGNITVKIPILYEINSESVKVYRKEADGSFTDINAVDRAGYMEFTTDRLGVYILTVNSLTVDSIFVDEIKAVNIETGGEYVLFKFVPEESEMYAFYSTGDVDTYGYLFDEYMYPLTDNDDSGYTGNNFYLSYYLEQGQTYYFGCRLYSSDNTGSFEVTLAYYDAENDPSYEEPHDYSVLLESYEATCTERGFDVYRCATCDDIEVTYTEDALGHTFSKDICTRCGMQKGDCLESSHPYSDYEDTYWILKKPGAASVAVTFSRDTFVEWNYDYIYIYDADNNLIGEYTGDELADKRIVVPGDTVKIRLISDGSVSEYGFAIKNVEANVPLEPDIMLGDINGDGVINSVDYAMVKDYVMYAKYLTDEQLIAADFDRDGAVDAFDVIAIDVYINSRP